MKRIESLKQVQALVGETYMYAVIVAIVAVVIAFIVANLIKYDGGRNSSDHIKRRVWYISIGIFATVNFFLYNTLYVSNYISKAPLLAKFSTANLWATLVVLGTYALLGIITMFIMRRSKWGSILGKSKK